ncbi:protein CLP1 homolog [Aethina tumida]|uniref:protein CLP1 homolog n=1 Tax=Aethina tumida TaxID=116153 RepID=UPI0021491E08|nr:protein CLP1 homolog [Aethina tumida]
MSYLKQEYKLREENELRFEIEGKNQIVKITLISSTAEIFGTELPEVIYVSEETPMISYVNCHLVLESMRSASELDKRGPVVLVVGAKKVGKSTLCRLLCNYAVRSCRRPLYVDLDVCQSSIGVPGTIGCQLVERVVDVNDGFSQESTLVYNFGHKTPEANTTLYSQLVEQLAKDVNERLTRGAMKIRQSGVVINTCDWIKGDGYSQLQNTAKAFRVDVIMVLDQERLYYTLLKDYSGLGQVVHLQKSSGISSRSDEMKDTTHSLGMRRYFYGTPKNSMFPYTIRLKFSDVKMFKIGDPTSTNTEDITKLIPLAPGYKVCYHLFAVSSAISVVEDLKTKHVVGFVCVSEVDVKRKTLSILSPQPGPLPSNILLHSEFQFMDDC